MPALTVDQLTEATLSGNGAFDTLMRAMKAHLDAEFEKNRIRGAEYAQVYLGSTQAVMNTAMQFLIAGQKAGLEADLLQQQILLAQVEVQKANAELAILQKQDDKITAEIAQLTAQTALTNQQTLNAVAENAVLVAQECKLRAEYDNLILQKARTTAETSLLSQKIATEKAQTVGAGVDADSVIGKQKNLYQAQTDGFARDAENKAAKLLVDTWSVRRTTDEATVADATNMLNDATIGRVVSKVLTGVGA